MFLTKIHFLILHSCLSNIIHDIPKILNKHQCRVFWQSQTHIERRRVWGHDHTKFVLEEVVSAPPPLYLNFYWISTAAHEFSDDLFLSFFSFFFCSFLPDYWAMTSWKSCWWSLSDLQWQVETYFPTWDTEINFALLVSHSWLKEIIPTANAVDRYPNQPAC